MIFVDEVGFSVSTCHKRGRSVAGASAIVTVPEARSRNISVFAAMNKYGMIFHKIFNNPVNGETFKQCLTDLKNVCTVKEIYDPLFILNNARIHHYRGLNDVINDLARLTTIFTFYEPN